MAFFHEVSTNKCGFHTIWQLSKDMLDKKQNLKTEEKSVDGMPDVKWYLTWNYDNGDHIVNFVVESVNEISYTTFLHYYKTPNAAGTQSGTLIGKQKIQIDYAPFDDKFDQYLQDGILTIRLHGFFRYTNTPTVRVATNADASISDAAEWGLRMKEHCAEDFGILVDGKTIQIHKLFLSVESSVFTRMFEDDFKEAKEGKVTITDFKHEIVQAAVDYCYAQNISSVLQDQSNIIDLLYFCDKYDFKTLKPKLEKLLAKQVCKEHVSLFASTADKTNSLQLRQACINFIRDLFNKNQGFPAEEVAAFDAQFLVDLVTQALNQ